MATTTDANGNVTLYVYDADDRVASLTNPVGNVTVFGYDALGRLASLSNPAIQANPLWRKTYTPDGLVASFSDAFPNTTNYAHDGFDRLSTTTFPDASTEVLTYDANSNVSTRKTRRGDMIAFAYDTLNRPCTKVWATSPIACGGTSSSYLVSYAYDLASRLIGVSDNSAAISAPSASASYTAAYAYDPRNELINVTWSPATAQTLPSASTSVTFGYSYDGDNRRIGQTATDKSWWNYPTTAASVAYTANNLNQYSAVGSVGPTYDGDGDLTSDGTFTYCYDDERRLTSILSAGTCASPTATVASYAYDARGRRKSKTVGSATTYYATDADNREVFEYSAGALLNWYSFALGPERRPQPDEHRWFHARDADPRRHRLDRRLARRRKRHADQIRLPDVWREPDADLGRRPLHSQAARSRDARLGLAALRAVPIIARACTLPAGAGSCSRTRPGIWRGPISTPTPPTIR